MTPDTPPDDDRTDEIKSVLDRVRALLNTIADLDEGDGQHHETGRIDRGRTTIDYEYTINVGLGESDRASRWKPARRPGGPTPPSRESSAPADLHVEQRTTDDGLLVVADLPESLDAAVTADVTADGRTLEIAVNGTLEEQIPIPEGAFEVRDVSVTNRVLEVRLHRSDSP